MQTGPATPSPELSANQSIDSLNGPKKRRLSIKKCHPGFSQAASATITRVGE
ncbi:MAG: hypothetical protein NDI95_16980 [Acidovorax soli]|uniref:hypothetical protein n=1 Tax=Acidovorax soli TaxID=592050 RepID=UPI0026EB4B21|nr:hypothetical protein [Acidovorax soli]MCM2348294.1 hypothetical protein [Acidovorax soli]